MIRRTLSWLPVFLLVTLTTACLGVTQEFEEPVRQTVILPTEATTTMTNTPIVEPVTPSAEFVEEDMMPTEQNPGAAPQTEETGTPDQAQSQPELEPAYPSSVEPLVNLAKEDLANRQSVGMEAIEVVSFESKVWPDSSLGCPQPGMMYLQVLKDGYLIQLRIGDEIYNYHGGEGRDKPFLCEQDQPPVTNTKQAPLNLKVTPTKEVPPPRD